MRAETLVWYLRLAETCERSPFTGRSEKCLTSLRETAYQRPRMAISKHMAMANGNSILVANVLRSL
jgi:hypothetical protein